MVAPQTEVCVMSQLKIYAKRRKKQI